MIAFNYNKITTVEFISLLTLLTIAIGVHGLQHQGQEVYYDFNPFINKKNNVPSSGPIRGY